MKTKDIITVSIAGVVLIVAIYFIYTMLFPAKAATNTTTGTKQTAVTNIDSKIDTDTLDKLKQYKDYGGSTLDDIGRVNPFGPLN